MIVHIWVRILERPWPPAPGPVLGMAPLMGKKFRSDLQISGYNLATFASESNHDDQQRAQVTIRAELRPATENAPPGGSHRLAAEQIQDRAPQ